MTFAILFGLGLASGIGLIAVGFQRVPRRTRCPKCGRRTDAVLPPPWLKPGQRWLSMRWCAFCDWEGVGRRGPARIPGRRVAHDSGFHWGADASEPDQGFRWAAPERPEPIATPPHHPSGFRFARSTLPEGTRPAHTSGFAWRAGDGSAGEQTPSAHGSGFRWREGEPEEGESRPGFRWGDARRPSRGFHWGA